MKKNLKIKFFLSFVLLTFLFSVWFFYYVFMKPKSEVRRFVDGYMITKPKTIIIQPLGNFDKKLLNKTYHELLKINPKFKISESIPHFQKSYNPIKNRYRADSILKFLRYKYGADTTILAITHPDISVTKGRIQDWGVMGLGYRPGNVCVVSTYRLNKKKQAEQFYKVCIHELGHTTGLPHCPDKTCYMRDADGGNPLDEEIHFCEKCQKHLKTKGWLLNS